MTTTIKAGDVNRFIETLRTMFDETVALCGMVETPRYSEIVKLIRNISMRCIEDIETLETDFEVFMSSLTILNQIKGADTDGDGEKDN